MKFCVILFLEFIEPAFLIVRTIAILMYWKNFSSLGVNPKRDKLSFGFREKIYKLFQYLIQTKKIDDKSANRK